MKTNIFKTLSTVAIVIMALTNVICGFLGPKALRYTYRVLAILGVIVLLSLLWDRIANSRFIRAVNTVMAQQAQVTEPDAGAYEECLTSEPVKVEPAPQTASDALSRDDILRKLNEAVKAKDLKTAKECEERLHEIDASEEAELLEICRRNGITK